MRAEFIGIKPVHDPQGATTAAVTEKIVEVLEKYDNLDSLPANSASVIMVERNGVAAYLQASFKCSAVVMSNSNGSKDATQLFFVSNELNMIIVRPQQVHCYFKYC